MKGEEKEARMEGRKKKTCIASHDLQYYPRLSMCVLNSVTFGYGVCCLFGGFFVCTLLQPICD